LLARHPRVAAGDVDTALIEAEIANLSTVRRPSAAVQALAGLAALDLVPAGHGSDRPGTSLVGWRHWGEASVHARLAWREETIELRGRIVGKHRYLFELAEGAIAIHVLSVDGERVQLECDGSVSHADVVRRNGEIGIFLGAETYNFSVPDMMSAADAEAAATDGVTAPLPGIVKLVHVSAGSLVKKGQAMIVMEAMKMEHTLRASGDGEVAEIMVGPGDLVEEGTILARLATEKAK
jgi:3-methylcrotonyl-CoA carboxylase alpha subunit